jgi:hypothetical protein
MGFDWTKHEPAASPFAVVAGNPTEYVVHSLSVPGTDEAEIQAALAEAVLQMCRLAEANVSDRTDMVLFEFDSVYSTLTVVYTNRGRDFDARDVLKVFCEGWRRETFDLSEDDQLEIWSERDGLVKTWVRRALRQPEAQATVAALAERGVVPAYATQPDATEFDPL